MPRFPAYIHDGKDKEKIKMEANGLPLRFLCGEEILEIPFFQRAYVWDKRNWQDLFEDLFNENSSHFFGSIILKRTKKQTGCPNKAIIIDGQQRLTTLSILIKALYDSIDNKNNKLVNDAIDALFYTLRSSSDDYELSILNSRNNREQYIYVIGNVENGKITSPIIKDLDNIDENDPRLLIKGCYKYFYSQLNNKTQEEKRNLWDSLFDKDNKILVVIDLDENDKEQNIFDTINSAGVRLGATDIIKNALFQKLIEITKDEKKVIQYYEDTWERTFEKDEDTIAYWSIEKKIGRLKRPNSELFLQTFAVINGIFDVEEHTIQQLSELYKARIKDLDENNLKNFISNITRCAEIYRKHIIDFNGKEDFEYNNDNLEDVEKRVSKILDSNDISTFNPYIVHLFTKYENKTDVIIEKLQELEKYVMGHLITKRSTKNFNKECKVFINDDNEIKNRLQEFTPEELKAGITNNISNQIGTVLLFWIELRRRSVANRYDIKRLQYTYQLEHIMPQKWEENWSDVAYVDQDGNELQANEESKAIRRAKIFSLGNMTLLNGRLNAQISNDNFNIKMEGDRKKKGIKDYSALSITKTDIVEKVYEQQKQWNEQQIIVREAHLGDEVVALWCENNN